jgi:hypothetical protein
MKQSTNPTTTLPTSPRRPNAIGTPTHVSEPAFEFLVHAIIEQVERDCTKEYEMKMKLLEEKIMLKNKKDDIPKNDDDDDDNNLNYNENENGEQGGEMEKGKEKNDNSDNSNTNSDESETQSNQNNTQELNFHEEQQKQLILLNETIAAKMERIGFDVGYRLVESLSQSKSLIPPTAHAKTPTQSLLQLEAIKFICKEFWLEVFRKQIDKLQTNHRGIFVLKDLDFKWLDKVPSILDAEGVEDEGNGGEGRIMAIKILALPCGLIRGALSNLGIAAVVSCDFMDDGKNMNSCSFNIKIK